MVLLLYGEVFSDHKRHLSQGLTTDSELQTTLNKLGYTCIDIAGVPRFQNNILGLFDIYAGQSITAQSGDHYRKFSNNEILRIRRLVEHGSDRMHLGFNAVEHG